MLFKESSFFGHHLTGKTANLHKKESHMSFCKFVVGEIDSQKLNVSKVSRASIIGLYRDWRNSHLPSALLASIDNSSEEENGDTSVDVLTKCREQVNLETSTSISLFSLAILDRNGRKSHFNLSPIAIWVMDQQLNKDIQDNHAKSKIFETIKDSLYNVLDLFVDAHSINPEHQAEPTSYFERFPYLTRID